MASTAISPARTRRAVHRQAPVQADRTGDAIAALDAQVAGFFGPKGVTPDELARVIANSINELPGRFETSSAVLAAMMSNDLLGRPDNYYERLAARYRAQTPAAVDQAIRAAVSQRGFVWLVVGEPPRSARNSPSSACRSR